MRLKIKLFILSALLIQGCFFSKFAYSETKYMAEVYDATGQYLTTGYVHSSYANARTDVCVNMAQGIIVGLSSDKCEFNSGLSNQINNYIPAYSKACTYALNGLYVNSDGTCSFTDPNLFDCSSRTDGKFFTTANGDISVKTGDIYLDSDNCVYIAEAYCNDTFCAVSAVGNGVTYLDNSARLLAPSPAQVPSTFSKIVDSTSTFDTTAAPTVVNADNSFTDVYTDTISKSQNKSITVTYDGNSVLTNNADGTNTNTTTVTTIITKPDGSTSETSNTVTTITSGGVTVDTLDINSGTKTTNTINPTVTTIKGSTTRTVDGNGIVTSQSSTSTEPVIEEPTNPNDPSAVPSVDSYVNADFSKIDSEINKLSILYDESKLTKPTFSLKLQNASSCNNDSYQLIFHGYTTIIDICTYVAIVQSILYWVFAVMTTIYLFRSATSLGEI